MNTKNIFKTLAVAMLMPAMLLTTACSSDNDLTNPNPENIIKKGYELPVTVSVTRQGSSDADATGNRASYNETSKKLEFSTGDKLFVQGSTSEAGLFAGELAYVSDGTFSGTITTEKTYSGTAAELFTVASTTANYIAATLLPAGYESTGFLYIDSNDGYDDYDDRVRYNYSSSFATSKTEGVEQLSYEAVGSYSGGFSLAPQNAILNFTITGLAANTEVPVAFSYGATVSKHVTTDASGTATFAIGVAYSRDLKTCTLTVGGNAITLVSSSKLLYSGKIYNITRSVAPAPAYTLLSAATTADYGKVVCAAGHLHDAKTAVPTGCTAVGIVGKVTGTGHGLILALQNATNQTWNTIDDWTSTTAYAGTTLKLLPDDAARGSLTSYTTLGSTTVSDWAVAQKSDYDAIFTNLGSTTGDSFGKTYDANVNAYITTGVGGTAMSSYYWSATESGFDNHAWLFYNVYWYDYIMSYSARVRPVLAF